MKAIVRNILLACIISMFSLFGVIGRKHTRNKMTESQKVESRKETITCLSVAFLACGLCAWRCNLLYKRLKDEREYRHRFNEYMRNSAFNRQH
jgi:hypothetical protein